MRLLFLPTIHLIMIDSTEPELATRLNAVNAKNIVRRQTRLSSVRNPVIAFMYHAQILVRKN